MQEQIAIQTKIRSEFEILQRKNPAYSMRAFAKKLQLSPSALSEIISGKRKISKKMALRILDRMQAEPTEVEKIISQFSATKKGEDQLAVSKLGMVKYKKKH